MVFILACLLVTGCQSCPSADKPHPAWANEVNDPDLEDVDRVSADLYRGPFPSEEMLQRLRQRGVRTVVNLSQLFIDEHRVKEQGLRYHHISVFPWWIEDKEVIRFLRIATDPEQIPVYVHCTLGDHRAGVMTAAYRVVVQGWRKQEAICEMQYLGGWSIALYPDLACYIKNMNVTLIRAALTAPPRE
jgi:tyrosine-protein phosphatase SIW14